jgi:tripartite-type tricarboxylate transporter receptor subunit TctC
MARVDRSRPAFTAMSGAHSRRLVMGVLATVPWSLCRAQTGTRWPTGPVTIVVPAPPGGAPDAFVRQLSESPGRI